MADVDVVQHLNRGRLGRIIGDIVKDLDFCATSLDADATLQTEVTEEQSAFAHFANQFPPS